MLVLLVLPKPVIKEVTPIQAVVPSESLSGEAEPRFQQLRIDFDWGIPLTQELESYRHVYISATRCRIGTLGAPLTRNITWTTSTQLSCFFDDEVHIYNPTHQCVEVSINEGRSFTNDCTRRLNGTRAPLIYDFNPKQSLIADSCTIILTGVGFDELSTYWCQFKGPRAQESTTDATYINKTAIQCEKPLITNTEEMHSLIITIYFSSSQWTEASQASPPVLAKRFDVPH